MSRFYRSVVCYKCGKQGHISPQCDQENDKRTAAYYKCGKVGHIFSQETREMTKGVLLC